MEYIFGTKDKMEILKVKGYAHTDLTGFHQIERTYPDQTITDNFRVVRKLNGAEDVEGSCYDWYEVDRHYRTIDKTGPLVTQAEDTDAMLVDQEYRLALLELSITENGG